jgi:hypothetical protein
LRARATKAADFFGFQILNSIRQACDDNFAPLGWPAGFYNGPDGPFVPWGDFDFTDPRSATFINPTAAQLASDGWMHETWVSNNNLGYPFIPFFDRIGTTEHARLRKSSNPLGIFNSETIAAGFKVRKGALVLSQGHIYDDVTSAGFGVFFPGGILHDQIQEMRLYDTVSGTLTKHTLAGRDLFLQASNFSNVLPAPHHIEEYFPAKGDAPKIFKTDEFQYGEVNYGDGTNGQARVVMNGTIEILVFWFYLTPASLPAFPLNINTASDFFFVG